MAEHNSSSDEDRPRIQSVEEIEEKDSLITDEPFIHWQRRKAQKDLEESKKLEDIWPKPKEHQEE